MDSYINVLNEFKKTIGYANVANQYVELCQRSFISEHAELFCKDEKMREYSKAYGLNLSALPEKNYSRVAQGYINSIHSSFMLFLHDFTSLPGAPTKSFTPKTQQQNPLEWVLLSLNPKPWRDEVRILYYICDYYRLVRNISLHGKTCYTNNEYRAAYSRITGKNKLPDKLIGKLDAPNEISCISFDDQVLFSNAACGLAEIIYYESEYNLMDHFMKDNDTIHRMVKGYLNNPKRIEQIIKNYFLRYYPVDQNRYDDVISTIVTTIRLR